ncbi:hypothetical protein PGB90_009085 [Kerria lacca]
MLYNHVLPYYPSNYSSLPCYPGTISNLSNRTGDVEEPSLVSSSFGSLLFFEAFSGSIICKSKHSLSFFNILSNKLRYGRLSGELPI